MVKIAKTFCWKRGRHFFQKISTNNYLSKEAAKIETIVPEASQISNKSEHKNESKFDTLSDDELSQMIVKLTTEIGKQISK